MTTLANLHHESCEVSIDRTTQFGNPYDYRKLGITREESVLKYKEWFYKRLQNKNFHDAVLSLRNKKLGCWCVPDLCHGHVIIEFLEGIPFPLSKKINSEEFFC